jgi:hypothetical protein
VPIAFFEEYVKIGNTMKTVPPSRPIYVYVPPNQYALMNGLPVNAQILMFIMDTYRSEEQARRNIHYVTAMPAEVPPGALVVTLQ